MNLFWCGDNLLLLAASVLVVVDRPQQRREPRVPCFRPVEVAFRIRNDELRHDGVAVDLTESGARLLLRSPDPAETPLSVRIDPDDQPLGLPAEAVRNDGRAQDGLFAVSVRFGDIGVPTRHRLIRRMYGDPETWSGGLKPEAGWGSFVKLAATVFRWTGAQESTYLRRSHRFPCRRPGVLVAGGGPRLAAVHPGSPLQIQFTLAGGGRLSIAGRAVSHRNGGVAIRFDALAPADRTALLWDLFVAPLRRTRRPTHLDRAGPRGREPSGRTHSPDAAPPLRRRRRRRERARCPDPAR